MTAGTDMLNRRDRIRLADVLPGVAEGSAGEVMMHAGLRIPRYWVRFDSGAERGSLLREKLVREENWEDFLLRREQEAAEQAAAPVLAQSDTSASGEAAITDAEVADVVVNGVTVPPHLLTRSASARERLGG